MLFITLGKYKMKPTKETNAQAAQGYISKGKEDVTMTVVHVSEVATVPKHGMSQGQPATIMRGLSMLDNVRIMDVTKDAYFAATELGEDLQQLT